MKLWTLAGLLTGLVALSMVITKHKPAPALSSRIEDNSDIRYAVDDLMADQDL